MSIRPFFRLLSVCWFAVALVWAADGGVSHGLFGFAAGSVCFVMSEVSPPLVRNR